MADLVGRMYEAIDEGDHTGLDLLLNAQASVNVDDRTSLASFAAKHRQPECLQVILRKGVILNGRVSVIAAFAGTESCLRLAHEFGDRWSSTLMSFAVSATDQFSDFPSVDVKDCTDCVKFLIEHNCPADDDAVMAAVTCGHVDIVKLLVAHGLPAQPITYMRYSSAAPLLRPNERLCIEHLLEKGCPIHPMTLIYAAKEGDLDSVRAFNSKGLGLWEYACYDQDFNFYHHRTWPHIQQEMKVIDIPKTREDATRMFKTLLYGWYRGAPVPPAFEAEFKAMRAATRATLLCFHVASRLSEDEGSLGEHSEAWCVMGRMKLDLIGEILIHADFEIKDTFRRPFPRSCRASVLHKDLPILVWTSTQNFDSWRTTIVKWMRHSLWNLGLLPR